MSEVYVVTMPELGWDCVIGVFNADSVSLEKLVEVFPEYVYVVHNVMVVKKDVVDYEGQV